VISSDIYAPERLDSDESLPDLAVSLGLPSRIPPKRPAAPAQRGNPVTDIESRVLVSTQETMTRINRGVSQAVPSPGMAQMKAYVERNLSWPSQDRITQPTTTTAQTRPAPLPAGLAFHLDPISSSSPLSSLNKFTKNRTNSFNFNEPIISSSPPMGLSRTPLHRANTFHSIPSDPISMDRHSLSQPTYYHEISDDDEDLRAAIEASQRSVSNEFDEDEALKSAIAASLVDMGPPPRIETQVSAQPKLLTRKQPLPRPTKPSVFQCPDDLFRLDRPSSPPEVEIVEIESQENPRNNTDVPREIHRARQQVPRSSPPSSQGLVREETKRMLDALDNIALNSLKRKNEDTCAPTKKKSTKTAGAENENPKPRKRAPLTQEEKVVHLLQNGINNRILGRRYKRKSKPPRKPNVLKKYLSQPRCMTDVDI